MQKLTEKYHSPIAIGGVGGSGTRLVAECLKETGFFMGSDLNVSNDNLWFTFLFRRLEILDSSDDEFRELVDIFLRAMSGSDQFTEAQINLISELACLDREDDSARWLLERAKTLLAEKQLCEPTVRWGWKEPNTHVIIDRLRNILPNIKYIHVMRNGLDMAHSPNQNQLKLWGKHFIGANYEISPFYSLKYWCIVHQRVLELSRSMGKDFLLINYDNLVLHPQKGLMDLLKFLGLDIREDQIHKLSRLIKVPDSIGRFKNHGTKIFDESDVAFVKQLGFITEVE